MTDDEPRTYKPIKDELVKIIEAVNAAVPDMTPTQSACAILVYHLYLVHDQYKDQPNEIYTRHVAESLENIMDTLIQSLHATIMKNLPNEKIN